MVGAWMIIIIFIDIILSLNIVYHITYNHIYLMIMHFMYHVDHMRS